MLLWVLTLCVVCSMGAEARQCDKYVSQNERPVDCSDIQDMGNSISGVYTVYPRGLKFNVVEPVDVYCDMDTDGGGWTVIQRRGSYPVQIDFYRDWQAYKHGFGDITEEFWMGNENIFTFTNQRLYSVRFDLKDVKGETRYAKYESFYIGDERTNYIMKIYDHSGTAKDGMKWPDTMFSTKDRRNENSTEYGTGCAHTYRGAYWYPNNCGDTNPNGVYNPGVSDVKGVWWWPWHSHVGLAAYEIKIRRRYR